MATLQELISRISDPALRECIATEANKLAEHRKFGLIFEEHLPECTPLYDIPIRKGSRVAKKTGEISDTYTVLKISKGEASCEDRKTREQKKFKLDEIVSVAEFGEPIYPFLAQKKDICNAPKSDLWHTLIEADNYHALQLLKYLYYEKVDCIYIDPPYNSGASDWKYNNNYVDIADSYRHSKWLSMMERRLKLAKKLLNPKDSVLIVTIDEREYLHLGCLLEQTFPEALIQMISSVTNPAGVSRTNSFYRLDEYIFFVMFGDARPAALPLSNEWRGRIKTSKKDKLSWNPLQRSGTDILRTDRPNMFYPIYFSAERGKIVKVGEPIPKGVDRHSVETPEGMVAVWPIFPDGREGRWRVGKKWLMSLIDRHYVRILQFRGEQTSISYLPKGEIAKVERGEFPIEGYNDDGSIKVDESKYEAKFVPGTQWWISSHNATQFGTRLLSPIIGSRFTFPKSLYAVHDALRFFVANKPNALILDFFAGSGTTLHAVNLLNAEDGGHRRCILVTNNEVSKKEAKAMTDKKLHPGDKEWDKHGIAEYVTWERIKCSVTGKNVKGHPLKKNYGIKTDAYEKINVQVVSPKKKKPTEKTVYQKVKIDLYPSLAKMKQSNGFKANVVYFKLGFLDKLSVKLGEQFAELLPILWMKAGAVGKCPSLKPGHIPRLLSYPKNHFAVLHEDEVGGFRGTDIEKLRTEIAEHPEIKMLYIVTDSDNAFKMVAAEFKGINPPCRLYKDYLENFKLNTRT